MKPCPQCGTPLENQVKVCPQCGVPQEINRPKVQPQPDGPGVSGPAERRSFLLQLAAFAVVAGAIGGGIAWYYWGMLGITVGIVVAAIAFVVRLMLEAI